MQLTTERCVLKPWTHADIDALWNLFRVPEVRRYLLDDALVPRDWIETQVAASQARIAAGAPGLFTVRRNGRLIGFVGFHPFFDPPRLQLIYGLHPDHVGQGLATEVARRAIAHWVEVGRGPVYASIDEPNAPSRRVLERLGFEEVGREWVEGNSYPQLHFEKT